MQTTTKIFLSSIFLALSISSSFAASECVLDHEIEELVISCESSDSPGFCMVREADHPEVEYESVCIDNE